MGLGLAVVTLVASNLAPQLAQSMWSRPTTRALLLATPILPIVISLARAWWSIRHELVLARDVERYFGFQERLSTWLELSSDPPTEGERGELYAALSREVARAATRIEPSSYVRISRMLPLACLAGGVITASLAWQIGDQALPTVSASPTTEAAISGLEVVADIQRVVQLLRDDAERNDSPYLLAVARALESLGETAAVPDANREELRREASRLREHLTRAYGDEGLANARPGEALAALEEWLGPESPPADPPREREAASDESAPDEMTPNATDGTAAPLGGSAAEDGGPPGTDELAEVGQNTRPARNEQDHSQAERGPGANQDDWELEGGDEYISAELAAAIDRQRRVMARLRAEIPASGDMGGAGAGASVEAGAGTREPFAEALPEIPAWDAHLEEVPLPTDEGVVRRIRVDQPAVQLEGRELTIAGQATAGTWTRHPETRRIGEYLNLRHKSLIAGIPTDPLPAGTAPPAITDTEER